MNPIIRNILVFIIAAMIGSIVNMQIINYGPALIPLPEGADMSTPESMKAAIGMFKPINFIVPFLAHALGTFIGAAIVAKYAASNSKKLALGIGALFLIGGIGMVMMVPSPLWFNILDLAMAYIPMGWLGWKLAGAPVN